MATRATVSLVPEPAARAHPNAQVRKKRNFLMAEIDFIAPHSLISSKEVSGTDVYNTAGEKLGSVDDILIDRVSGRSIYAVMSFGGFLGMGQNHHPLPWSTLKYDETKGGYVVNLDKKRLLAAPTYDRSVEFKWTPEFGREVDSYYDAPSYWQQEHAIA